MTKWVGLSTKTERSRIQNTAQYSSSITLENRENGAPSLEDVSTLEWLHEAAGARALINQTNTRMAFDIRRHAENPGSVLVFKSYVKMKGENGTLFLERVCNDDGDPIG
jgi:hypothetical protein